MAHGNKFAFTLPLPPSANRMWRKGKYGQLYKTPVAKVYHQEVGWIVRASGMSVLDGDIVVTMRFYRARKSGDLDNRIKLLLDSLQGVAYHDDKQVIELHAFRFDDKDNPRIEVEIENESEAE